MYVLVNVCVIRVLWSLYEAGVPQGSGLSPVVDGAA